MSEVTLEINGREVKAQEGVTVLEAAKSVGIEIPTLCYHEKLEPYGGCRICCVEVKAGERTRIVPACTYPVADGMVVNTESDKVVAARRMLLELLMTRAPTVKKVQDLAHQYGVERSRFEAAPSFCVLCGLCVRYCDEVKKKNAVTFVGRGVDREIMFVPEIAAKECPPCQECFELCPTGVLKPTFLLSQALTC